MRPLLRRVHVVLVEMGIDPWKIARAACSSPAYFASMIRFRRMARRAGLGTTFGALHPCLTDRLATSGSASGHYFHQDLWVAQQIFRAAPQRHVDIGSRIDGFVAHVASYREIEVLDIRPQSAKLHNIRFVQADATKIPDGSLVGRYDSVSCLHALEHFGLGRYGDPLDPVGHHKGVAFLKALCAPGGRIYVSVPIGPERIEFNAHRVFSVESVLSWFEGDFELESFCYVDDLGEFHHVGPLSEPGLSENFGCTFGCAIFQLRKQIATVSD